MPMQSLDVVACLAAAALAYLIHYRYGRAKSLPYPPGPPGLPLIGNLRDIPPDPAWTTYLQWTEEYGSDVIHLSVLGSHIIVTNTLSASMDLLERRSSNYSDREELTMLNELCGFGWNPAFQPYGDEWRGSRRAFHQIMGPDAVKRLRELMIDATHKLIRNLSRGDADVLAELRLLAGSEILRTAYGINVQSPEDPFIETAEHALHAMSMTANAGSYLVDIVPILKHIPAWFPGAKFKRDAKTWKSYVDRMKDDPWAAIKGQMEEGSLPDCGALRLLEALERNPNVGYTETVIKQTLGSMYTGGSDTTVSSLGSFFLAMVLYPEFQLKAQQEIDEICSGRIPDFADRSDLPYVEALVKECLRWHPVVPLAVPHRSMADDIYNGYLIPKGSLVVANGWAILHDERIYENPLTFNPERFLKGGKINPDVQDPSVACFGFGRRICPGRFLAYESMWITIASTLATLNILKAKGPDGEPITPDEDYLEGFLCYPKPFKCDIQPRSAEHKVLIEATA